MKLLIVTSLKEHQPDVARLLAQAGITVFSASETTGFKNQGEENLLSNWFARSRDQYNSIFLFSFTTLENAEQALELIREHNRTRETGFPIRAFMLPVEKSSYE
jgi:hypothetical protein